MKLVTKLDLVVAVVASAPFLAHCAVEVRTPRVYVAPPPPPPPVQVDVAAAPAPPEPAPTVYEDTDPSALTDFHSVLDAHGQWMEDSRFGTVWVPNPAEVGPDWVPYSGGGHWTYGDDYVWVSDYDWGWAPFHYGRWVVGDNGWSWIPGRVYAPAWVSWSTGDPGYAYVGWAPAPPEYYWRGGAYVTVDFVVQPRYAYVGTNDMFSAHLGGVVLRGSAAVSVGGRLHPFNAGGAGGAAGGVQGGHAAGPAPTALGINPTKVTHPPLNDPGLAKAKGFGNPATAANFGGHPPIRTSGLRPGAFGNTATASHGATPTNIHTGDAHYAAGSAVTSGNTATTGKPPARGNEDLNNPAMHQQGASAAAKPTAQPKPTATATSAPPSRGAPPKKH
jgi:hypothetical protein